MLLGLLVVIWAVSWPVIKIGVATVSPIWYACLRYLIATSCLFVLVTVRGELVVPSRSDWRLVAVSGVFQMGAYSALTALALTILPPGRASVLAFSTPLWVVPLAAWWLREPVSRRSRYGVGFGLLGVLVIASPALQQHGDGQFASYAMLMSAAAAWAISIVFVRAHRFDASPLALAPWQSLVAVLLLAPLAAVIEGAPHAFDWRGVASLAYVGPVATAFAYWAIVEVGRELRASTISMALLATPSLGLLISTLTLGERVTGSLATGVLLVGAGIRLATSNPPIRSRATERSA